MYTQIFGNLFPGRFLSIQLCSRNFPEFSVEWFAFREFTSFRNFWKLFLSISVPLLPLVPNFSKVLVELEASIISESINFHQKTSSGMNRSVCGKRSDCHSKIFHRNDLQRNVPFTFWKWFVNNTQPKVCFSTFEFRELIKLFVILGAFRSVSYWLES